MGTVEAGKGEHGGSQPKAAENGYLVRLVRHGVGFRVRSLVLLVFIGLAAVAFADSTLFSLLSAEPSAAPVVGAVATMALVPAALVALYVWISDPGKRVSVSVLAAGFLLGAVVTIFAATLNGFASGRFDALPVYALPLFFYVFVGPVEEGLKILALHLHPASDRRLNRAMEYAVVGAFVGLGFAFVENAFYVVSDVVLMGGSAAVTETVVTRASVGPLHVILTAVAGYYVGKARLSSAGYGAKVVTASKGLLAVALLHGTYNTMVTRLSTASNLPAQGSVGAGVVDGQAATPVFILGFFVVILYLLERVVRESRRNYAANE